MTIPDLYSALPWQDADAAQIDRMASYLVQTNDGCLEVWGGSLLYIRLRPEFRVGRAERVARINWNEWERVA